MFAQGVALIDDVAKFGLRGLFRRPESQNAMKFNAMNPGPFMNAVKSGNAKAIAGMENMHYGAFYNSGKRTILSGLAEREVLRKGQGFSGLIFGRPMKGLSVGLSHAKGLGTFAIAGGVFEGFTAARGHKMSGFVGGVARTMAYAAGDVIGSMIGGPFVGAAVGMLTEKAGAKVGDAMQFFNELHHTLNHINMGGNYEDTRVAYTMRQRAAAEMGSSVMGARTWLGKEGALLHQ